MTSTLREPRLSITRTVVPRVRGRSDQAIKHSDPPRTLIWTSPGPLSPRVATVSTPTAPIVASSRGNSGSPFAERTKRSLSRSANTTGRSAINSPSRSVINMAGRALSNCVVTLVPLVPTVVINHQEACHA
jgi:hypothetical protein